MVKIPVCLNNMTDAKHLVQIAEGCDKDVDLMCGKYLVDAKSMLGVFSLPQFDNVEMCVDESEKDKVYEKLEQMNLLRLRRKAGNCYVFSKSGNEKISSGVRSFENRHRLEEGRSGKSPGYGRKYIW